MCGSEPVRVYDFLGGVEEMEESRRLLSGELDARILAKSVDRELGVLDEDEEQKMT